MNFRYKLIQFMSGRNGVDSLTNLLLIFSAALAFVNLFLRLIWLQYIVYILIIYAVFRVLSRNVEQRRRENRYILNILNSIKQKRELYNQRKMDKYNIYRRCPACKATLRLPHKKGRHKTICPKCNKEFSVWVRK